jgi:CubicO group peptidase (beta-lactamase class C family)
MKPRRRAVLKALPALALAPLLPSCAASPERTPTLERDDLSALHDFLRGLVDDEVRAQGIAGLSLALVDGPGVAWAHGAGWADVDGSLPATADTLYRVGSLAKLFTTVAALQLAAQGRLDLDAPLQAVLPEFAIRSRYGDTPITARLLLTHHAGLPRDVLSGQWSLPGVPGPDFRAMVAGLREADLCAPPGLLMSYSNVGFCVLGAAVERLAGRPFEQHLRESVLTPLGMERASFGADPSLLPALARGHLKGDPAQEPVLRDVPAGGLNAGVRELGRLLCMVFGGGRVDGREILPPAQLQAMLQPQNLDAELDLEQRTGLGWMLDGAARLPVRGAGVVAHHAGATPFHRARVLALPVHRLGVVVASNDARAGPAVRRVARIALEAALMVKTGLRRSAGAARPMATPVRGAGAVAPDQDLADWPGLYTTPAGLVRIARDGDTLKARVLGRELRLALGDDGTMRPRYALLGLIPLRVSALDGLSLERRTLGEREVLAAYSGSTWSLLGERLQALDEPTWRGVAGRYVPVLAPGEVSPLREVDVFEEDGVLLVRPRLAAAEAEQPPVAAVVRVLSDTEALLLGPLADAGEVVRRIDVDGRPGFRFAGCDFVLKGA